MKKLVLFILISLSVFSFSGCRILLDNCDGGPEPYYKDEVGSFSYAKDLALYSEESPNVKRDGFVNTSELKHAIGWNTDAIELAKNECSVEIKIVNYYARYDSESEVWRIRFFCLVKLAEGVDPQYACRTVYMSDKGVTLLVVCGEAPRYREDVSTFSYAEDLALYSEDSPNVKRDGFVNSSESSHPVVIDLYASYRAANECSLKRDIDDRSTSYYDPVAEVWKIEIWDAAKAEDGSYRSYVYQTVYMNVNGKTLLIVYGAAGA